MTKRKFAAGLLFALAALAAGLLAAAPAALAAEKTVVLSVPDMECGAREIQANTALRGLEGVKDLKLDTDEKTATVTYDDGAVDVEAMKKALEEFGMPASVAGEKAPAGGE
ncbi:MAG: cation transporter [Nitrospirota bacterium]